MDTTTPPPKSEELRHRLHQEMLKEHAAARAARIQRRTYATPRRHKQDSECFGFKTISVPKV
jgi:hypothetical protein